jgi:hypothetical protein
MMNSHRKPDGFIASSATAQSLQRLQLEMAIEARNTGARSLPELLADAAEAAGADLLFVLPATDGKGESAVVRLSEDGIDSFLQVTVTGSTFAVSEQTEMDQILLRLARASVDVLGRLADHGSISEPFAAEIA